MGKRLSDTEALVARGIRPAVYCDPHNYGPEDTAENHACYSHEAEARGGSSPDRGRTLVKAVNLAGK